MERTSVQKLAHVLKVLVLIVLVCNIVALALAPGAVLARASYRDGNFLQAAWRLLRHMPDDFSLDSGPILYFAAWIIVWLEPQMAVLTVFLLGCGVCTAVILWQARRVLNTILAGNPFCMDNARSVKRAAVCCFLIALLALARTVWSLLAFRSASVLLTYNTLFVPIFLLAGLLCMVISALFRQAAELKEDSDLTI